MSRPRQPQSVRSKGSCTSGARSAPRSCAWPDHRAVCAPSRRERYPLSSKRTPLLGATISPGSIGRRAGCASHTSRMPRRRARSPVSWGAGTRCAIVGTRRSPNSSRSSGRHYSRRRVETRRSLCPMCSSTSCAQNCRTNGRFSLCSTVATCRRFWRSSKLSPASALPGACRACAIRDSDRHESRPPGDFRWNDPA